MASFGKALSPAIREIRILCCQSAAASAGTRQFINSTYPTLKKHNPQLPIMIREASGTPARAFARYEFGMEKHVELDNLAAKDVEQKLSQLLTS